MNSLFEHKNNRNIIVSVKNIIAFSIIVIAVSLMYFLGLINSFIILRTNSISWPPANHIYFPPYVAAFNIFILFLSLFFIRNVTYKFFTDFDVIKRELLIGFILGALFLVVQGYEWYGLVNIGFNAQNTIFGSYFYIIIVSHAVHVLFGCILLGVLYIRMTLIDVSNINKSIYIFSFFCSFYWTFVVILWPIIYVLLYI